MKKTLLITLLLATLASAAEAGVKKAPGPFRPGNH